MLMANLRMQKSSSSFLPRYPIQPPCTVERSVFFFFYLVPSMRSRRLGPFCIISCIISLSFPLSPSVFNEEQEVEPVLHNFCITSLLFSSLNHFGQQIFISLDYNFSLAALVELAF